MQGLLEHRCLLLALAGGLYHPLPAEADGCMHSSDGAMMGWCMLASANDLHHGSMLPNKASVVQCVAYVAEHFGLSVAWWMLLHDRCCWQLHAAQDTWGKRPMPYI